MTFKSHGPEWVTHDLQTSSEARISSTQHTTHEKIMQGWAKGLSVTADVVSTGAEFAAIGITGGTKIAAKTLLKAGKGIVRGLSA